MKKIKPTDESNILEEAIAKAKEIKDKITENNKNVDKADIIAQNNKNVDMADIIAQIKKLNKDTKLSVLDIDKLEAMPKYTTGVYVLDHILGGGIPRGKFIEISGSESSGKTTISQILVKATQEAGYLAAWLDIEKSFEPFHAQRLGVDISKLLIEEPETGEDAFKNLNALVKIPKMGLVVVDSVSAMLPEEEKEESKKYALLAKLMSEKLKLLNGNITKDSPTIVFINQLRDKMNAMPFADQNKTTGGRALPFYSHIRLRTSQVAKIKNKEETKIIGVKTKVENKKNKVGMPFRTGIVGVDYRSGIDKHSGLFELLTDMLLIKKAGKTFTFNGKEYENKDFKEFFENNKEELIKLLEE